MTFIQSIHPDNPALIAAEEYRDFFDAMVPDWETRQDMGTRFLTEADFPVEPPAPSGVTVADWDAYREMTYVDPYEYN